VERELRAFCRPSSTSTTTAHNNSSNQQSGGAAQPVSPPSTQQQASPLPHQQPASCSSDITGTDDPSSASRSQNCRDANRFLHAARVTREKYPVYADDQYKKAAASARAAGDTELELSILREATSPPAPQPPLEEACAEPAREAASYIKGAEAIEKEDQSCDGLLQAAQKYFTAGSIFLRAIKPGLTNEQIEASCENKKTNEMFHLRDALINKVERKRDAGECRPTTAGSPVTEICFAQPCDNDGNCTYKKEDLPCTCPDGATKIKNFRLANPASISQGRNVSIYECVAPDGTASQTTRSKQPCLMPSVRVEPMDRTPDGQCVVADNTNNDDDRCFYGFTYTVAYTSVLQKGSVAAGKTTQICHQANPQIKIQSVTLTAPAAR
jgi:hypothetical protein